MIRGLERIRHRLRPRDRGRRPKTVDPYYGTSFYTIDFSGEQPLIRRKTVVLKNDYIHHVVDVYHF